MKLLPPHLLSNFIFLCFLILTLNINKISKKSIFTILSREKIHTCLWLLKPQITLIVYKSKEKLYSHLGGFLRLWTKVELAIGSKSIFFKSSLYFEEMSFELKRVLYPTWLFIHRWYKRHDKLLLLLSFFLRSLNHYSYWWFFITGPYMIICTFMGLEFHLISGINFHG